MYFHFNHCNLPTWMRILFPFRCPNQTEILVIKTMGFQSCCWRRRAQSVEDNSKPSDLPFMSYVKGSICSSSTYSRLCPSSRDTAINTKPPSVFKVCPSKSEHYNQNGTQRHALRCTERPAMRPLPVPSTVLETYTPTFPLVAQVPYPNVPSKKHNIQLLGILVGLVQAKGQHKQQL